jgi:hypothetical protein
MVLLFLLSAFSPIIINSQITLLLKDSACMTERSASSCTPQTANVGLHYRFQLEIVYR